MKTIKILTILVAALCLILCRARVGEAAPMGTAFTYQGRLIDANDAADGLYDFVFNLYDGNDPCDANEIGGDVNKPDVDVIDGYFTVVLDFGSGVFDGNAVWLGIGVRPGEMNDTNTYTTLSPRQQVSPTPYALQTRGLFVSDSENVGIGTKTPVAKLDVAGNARIDGDIKLTDTGSQVKFAHTSSAYLINVENLADTGIYYDAMNNYWEWRGTGVQRGRIDLDNGNLTVTGNVGIGTSIPTVPLHVESSSANTGVRLNNTAADGDVFMAFDLNSIRKFTIGVDDSDDDKLKIGTSGLTTNTRLAIDSSGNVGIGATTPEQKLEVNGDTAIDGANLYLNYDGPDSDCYIYFYEASNPTGRYLKWSDASNRFEISDYLYISGNTYVSSTAYLYGDVLLGNSNADNIYPQGRFEAYTLHVGNAGVEDYTDGDGDLYVEDELEVDGSVNIGDSASDIHYFTGDIILSDDIRPYSNNTGYVGSSTYYWYAMYTNLLRYKSIGTFSDKKVKKNIRSIENPLDKIMSLEGRKFDLNPQTHPLVEQAEAEENKDKMGFIAQELMEVVPEMVSLDEETGLYMIENHHQLLPVVVEAMKQQQRQIKQQQAQIESLVAKVETLEHTAGQNHLARAKEIYNETD